MNGHTPGHGAIEAEYSTTDAYNRVIDLQVPQTTAQAAYDTSSNAYAWNGNYSQVQRVGVVGLANESPGFLRGS